MYEISRLKQILCYYPHYFLSFTFLTFYQNSYEYERWRGEEQFHIITSSAKLSSYDSYLSAQL